MKTINDNFSIILDEIDDCLKKTRIVPCLILIYSTIDSFSSLANRSNKKGRKVFMNWVRDWMLGNTSLKCNEIDIYAARCGLLHQNISESDLSKAGEAREIFYCWGQSDIRIIEETIKKRKRQDSVVALRIEDLITSLKEAIVLNLEKISTDKDWEKEFQRKGRKYFVNIMHEN